MQDRFKTLLVIFILAVLTFAVYRQVGNFEFINYDDYNYVSQNEHITSGLKFENIIWAFTHEQVANWHPLTGISLMLDCQLFGINPGKIHIINLLFHIINSLLVFTVFKQITKAHWRSAILAALFALHPLHVESVAWISERKDVLSTFFFLLTILAYYRFVNNPRLINYLLSIALFACGLMAKPMLVTLPLILLILDYWPLNRFEITGTNRGINRSIIFEKIPFFLLSAASCLITFFVQRSIKAVGTIEAYPLTTRISNALASYVRYIAKTFWPADLAMYYPYPRNGFPGWLILFYFVVLIFITFAVIRLGKKYKYLPAGWFWYLLTLIPVIGLVQVGDQAMADRYTYIPLIGLFVMISWATDDLFAKLNFKKQILTLASVLIIAAISLCTYFQTALWRDDITLFEHTVKVTGGNHIIFNNLGIAYGKLGRLPEAIDAFNKSANMNPEFTEAYFNLAIAFRMTGQFQKSIEVCKKAIEINPDYINAYRELAAAYSNLNMHENAIETYNRLIKIKPQNAEAYFDLSLIYVNTGRYNDAINELKKAISLNPDYAEAYNNLGAVYNQLGQHDLAREMCKKAVAVKPDYIDAHFNLGINFALTGDSNSALEEYKILQKLNPEKAGILLNSIQIKK